MLLAIIVKLLNSNTKHYTTLECTHSLSLDLESGKTCADGHTHTHTQNQTPTYMHAMTDWDESHRPLFKCINYIIIR